MGLVDDILLLENESFEVIMTDLKDKFTIEKAVNLHLKDYGSK